MRRLLPLLWVAACLLSPSFGAPAGDPITTAFDRWAVDDVRSAAQVLGDHVMAGAARLGSLDAEEADRLADDLEFSAVLLGRMAAELDSPAFVRSLIDGVQVDPAYGMLRARLAWLRGDAAEELGCLVRWSIAGPFDNERGRGMTRPTPAEQDPTAASYAGKVREVSWRELPEPFPATGVLRLGALLDPATQVCVVARTWVRSEVGRDVLLLLGAAEEVRVWSQGKPRYEALGGYDFGTDGHAIPLRLDPGWTELVIKVGGGEDASPTFAARLVEPVRGRAVRLEHTALAPDGLGPRQIEDPGGKIRGDVTVRRPGAWRRYADGDMPEDRFRLAVLQQDAMSAPRSERPGRTAAQAAATARPGVLRYELVRLSTLREQGALATEEDTAPWRTSLDGILAEHGDRARLLRERAEHAAYAQGLLTRALEYNARSLESNPASVPGRWQRVRLLESLGQRDSALHEAAELAREAAALDWVSIAADLANRLPVGDARAEDLLKASAAGGRLSALLELSGVRRLRADDRSAETLAGDLEHVLTHRPWSTQARVQLGRAALAMGEPAFALELFDDAIRIAPQRASLRRQRYAALLQLGRRDEAIAAVEAAVELDFGDEDSRRLLEALRETDTEAFYVPWERSLEGILAQRAADAPVEADTAGREVLLDQRIVEVQPDGGSKTYRRSVQRVLSEAGARQLDRRSWRAFQGQEVRVLQADVLHADGRIDRAPTGRSGRRGIVNVDLPPLVPGDVVDLVWSRDESPSEVFGDYFGLDVPLVAEASLPLRESELILIWPESQPLFVHARNLPEAAGDFGAQGAAAEPAAIDGEDLGDGRRLARWSLVDHEPVRVEPWMPPGQETGPRIQASTYASWADFGRWWWNLIKGEIRVSPEMRERVAELTAGAATPLEKLRSIYDFVVTDIRYNAWEFGVHGYEPYSAPVIFSRGFGDCKDKAILLRAMLGVAGIEALPVLIRSEPRRFEEDLELALVSHFNHCIAWVPEQPGIPEMYLDGTARLHPLEVLPDSDAGAKVVIVGEGRAERARIPFPSADSNVERRTIRLDLSGEDGPRVQLELDPQGRYDARDRYRFTGSEKERDEEAERLLSGLFGALNGDVASTWPDFEDLGQSPVTVLEAGVESVSRSVEGGFELDSSFDQLELLRTLAAETSRTTDLLLDVPWTRETTLELVLAPDAEVPVLPEPLSMETPDAGFVRTVERTEQGVRIVDRFSLRTQRIEPERYAAFRELAREVDRIQSSSIKVQVKP